MQKIRYVDFYPDEWIAGTVGMSLADEGLYIRVCALIYSHGGPVALAHLKKTCFHDHGHHLNACLQRLLAMGKLTLNGDQIDSKRCANEIQKACKRITKARQNGAKGGRPNGLAKPDGYAPEKANPNYQPERKKDLASKELNPVFLSSREATTPLPSQGDGAAASRSRTTKEPQLNSDDLISPEEKAAALAELHRALDAARTRGASLNGHTEAAE